MVIASPAGIASTTPHTTQLHAGEHIALTSGVHISLSVGKSLLVTAKKGIKWLGYKAGIRLIAIGNRIDVQTVEHSINLLAKLTITEKADEIEISAKEEGIINGGGSYTKWSAGGIEKGTSGSWKAHASGHSLERASNKLAPHLANTVSQYSQQLNLKLNAVGKGKTAVRAKRVSIVDAENMELLHARKLDKLAEVKTSERFYSSKPKPVVAQVEYDHPVLIEADEVALSEDIVFVDDEFLEEALIGEQRI